MNIPVPVLNLAKRKLRENKCPFKHISVITHKGIILCYGMNSVKTHPSANGQYRATHSELSAILKMKKTNIDLSKTILYNVRIGSSGILLSRPCQFCAKLIYAANFKKVYYSNNFGLLEEFVYKN